MQWITFRLHHGCPFARLSEQHPTVPMANWCNYNVEILEFEAPGPRMADVIQEDLARLARDGFKTLRATRQEGNARTVLMRCGHDKGDSVDDVIEAHGGLVLYPVVFRAGWEHYRVAALDETQVDAMFQRLRTMGEVEVTTKRSMDDEMLSRTFVLSTNELFAGLTGKQATALVAAVEHGYYNLPRRIRFEDIAKARKVPRTTFEEHVRKAESKLITALAPYVAMHVNGTPAVPARAGTALLAGRPRRR